MANADIACNARNAYFGKVYSPTTNCDLYFRDNSVKIKNRLDRIPVQYQGMDLSVNTFTHILTSTFFYFKFE